MPSPRRYALHAGLFIVTLVSTAFTGATVFVGRSAAWAASNPVFSLGALPVTESFLSDAFTFAGGLILFLTIHEFGHYTMARKHSVRTSLPYFIPAPFIGIGTLGAVISIREPIPSSRKLFDIGAGGPLAGFVFTLALLIWALAALPTPDYMFGVGGHDALLRYIEATGHFPDAPLSDAAPGMRLTVGSTPLYWGLSQLFANVPPMYEMYHYPLLFAAWLGLFFTALNLMPVGQLDGGHIVYALFGRQWHGRIARAFILLMLCSMAVGGAQSMPNLLSGMLENELLATLVAWFALGAILAVCTRRVFGAHWLPATVAVLIVASIGAAMPNMFERFAYFGWLPWCLLLVFVIKVDHPPVENMAPLSPMRKVLGLLSLLIFVLCFSIRPLYGV